MRIELGKLFSRKVLAVLWLFENDSVTITRRHLCIRSKFPVFDIRVVDGQWASTSLHGLPRAALVPLMSCFDLARVVFVDPSLFIHKKVIGRKNLFLGCKSPGQSGFPTARKTPHNKKHS
jgi:hypothetical protein